MAALRFIRLAKDLGFTLPEIAELLGFCRHEAVDCATVRKRAEAKIADIEGRMAALARWTPSAPWSMPAGSAATSVSARSLRR